MEFLPVELTKEEYEQWLGNPTTVKIKQLAEEEQVRVCLAMGRGETLHPDPGETQRHTAMNTGLVEGLMWPFQIQFDQEDVE